MYENLQNKKHDAVVVHLVRQQFIQTNFEEKKKEDFY